jgi:hypothetical protein
MHQVPPPSPKEPPVSPSDHIASQQSTECLALSVLGCAGDVTVTEREPQASPLRVQLRKRDRSPEWSGQQWVGGVPTAGRYGTASDKGTLERGDQNLAGE